MREPHLASLDSRLHGNDNPIISNFQIDFNSTD